MRHKPPPRRITSTFETEGPSEGGEQHLRDLLPRHRLRQERQGLQGRDERGGDACHHSAREMERKLPLLRGPSPNRCCKGAPEHKSTLRCRFATGDAQEKYYVPVSPAAKAAAGTRHCRRATGFTRRSWQPPGRTDAGSFVPDGVGPGSTARAALLTERRPATIHDGFFTI